MRNSAIFFVSDQVLVTGIDNHDPKYYTATWRRVDARIDSGDSEPPKRFVKSTGWAELALAGAVLSPVIQGSGQ